MPPKLTPQQELDTAFARNQAGTASVEDMKNIAYAKRTQGYTPTAPSVPTVQQIYGEPVAKTPLQLLEERSPTPSITPTSNLTPNVNSPLNAVYKEYEEGLNTGFAVDENKIQNDTLAQFQQQIDATNKVYADMLAKEVQASRGRTGQDTAIQARRGMLGSDFGAAQAATVERGNIEQQNYVENQRLAAISKILTQAKTDATARIAEEKALKKASLEDKIAYYKSAAERRETNASKAAQALLAQGLDLTKVTPLELSRLTQYYNVDKEDIEMAFNLVKQQQEQANAAANIKDAKVLEEGEILVGADGKIIATGTTGGQTVTLNEGQIVYKIGPNGEYIEVAKGGEKDTRTSEQKNYEEAVAGGYTGTFIDFTTDEDNGGFTPYQRFTATQGLRKELSNNTESARTVKQQSALMTEALNRVKTGETKDLNATSQAIITTFNKILDPTSVVREGEYDRTAKGQSLINRIEGKLVQLQQGGAGLNVGALEEIVNLGNELADSYAEYAEAQNAIITDNANAFGLDASLVVPNTTTRAVDPKVEKMRADGLSDDVIEQVLGRPITFNSVGTDTNKGVMRTDRHNNPTAFTTDVAKTAGLVEGVDYVAGDPFPNNPKLRTAKLIGDPIEQTIKTIDRIGFYTQLGQPRWTHTAIPQSQWSKYSKEQKAQVIKQMYQKEGGTALNNLFNSYG